MDKKDSQVVAIGEGKQENGQPMDSGAGFLSLATGLEVGPKASRGRHSRRQTLEKAWKMSATRLRWSRWRPSRQARVGQVPPEVLDMYDQLTRDQHALVRTSNVLRTALRRRLGLSDL